MWWLLCSAPAWSTSTITVRPDLMACDVADLPDVDWENASTVDLMDPGFVYTAPVIDTRLAGEVDVTISSSVGAAIGPGPTLEIRGDP